MKIVPNKSAANTATEVDNLYHVTSSSNAAQGVLNGIDPKFLNPNSRFGAAFYVAEKPETTIAELAHHGVKPSHGIRYEFNPSNAKILDLSNSKVRKRWGYQGGPINSATQKIRLIARELGFDAIRLSYCQIWCMAH